MLTRCASDVAPWYVVPADRKWYRNLAVAETLVETLSAHGKEWREALLSRGKKNYEALTNKLQPG